MTVTLVVLDSVGVGALPDADGFGDPARGGDAGSHTLDHTLEHAPVKLPNLTALGLGSIEGVSSLPSVPEPLASFGRMRELSPGKDTTTGHWEFMGVVLQDPFRTYERFPAEVMEAFDAATGRGHLGNRPASGTTIIAELGEEHVRTGFPIVYTSADSVFQVAAHVDVVPLPTLYAWCEAARRILVGEHAVARVIARPFEGRPGAFQRLNSARRDFSMAPESATVLDALKAAGREVVGVGKVPDIYAHRGFTREVKAGSDQEGFEATVRLMDTGVDGLIMTNLVEFDSVHGHRRDPVTYAGHLRWFDQSLPRLLAAVREGDVLMLVSDHGNDPTWYGTDHTREHGLLLAYAPGLPGTDLGTRGSFADVGATVADLLGEAWAGPGRSFAAALRAR